MDQTNNKVQYAGFWLRVLAYTLDTIIFCVPLFLLNLVLYTLLLSTGVIAETSLNITNIMQGINDGNTANIEEYITTEQTFKADLIILFIESVLIIFIYKCFLTSKWQATPGKRLLEIYVTDTKGKKLSSYRAILRTSLPLLLSVFYSTFLTFQLYHIGNVYEEAGKHETKAIKELAPISYQKYLDAGIKQEKITYLMQYLPNFHDRLISGDHTEDELVEKFSNYFYFDDIKDQSLKEDLLREIANVDEESIKKYKVIHDSLAAKFLKNSLTLVIFWLIFIVLCLVWYLMAAFTKEKTALHDVIAKTRVVKGTPST